MFDLVFDEKEEGKKMAAPRSQLLSEYVDLLNAHGRDSAPARAFRDAHADDPELTQLIAVAHGTQDQLASGKLKCDEKGNLTSD